jgi:hypothetical protein
VNIVFTSDSFLVFVEDNNIVTCIQEAMKASLIVGSFATRYARPSRNSMSAIEDSLRKPSFPSLVCAKLPTSDSIVG